MIYLVSNGVIGKGLLASIFIFVNISVVTRTDLRGAFFLSWGFPNFWHLSQCKLQNVQYQWKNLANKMSWIMHLWFYVHQDQLLPPSWPILIKFPDNFQDQSIIYVWCHLCLLFRKTITYLLQYNSFSWMFHFWLLQTIFSIQNFSFVL